MADIALVNMCAPNPSWIAAAPQGSLSLATFLHAAGISSEIYDTAIDFSQEGFTWQAIAHYLSEIRQRFICVSLWDSVLPKALLALRHVKEADPSCTVIIGGPSVSASGHLLLKHFPWIDFACLGEGERCLCALVEWMSFRKTHSELPSRILCRDGDRILSGTTDAPVLGDGEIPMLDYSLIHTTAYSRGEVVTSRGCPFACPFCSVHLGMGRTLRFRSLDHVFAEIQYLLEERQIDTVHLLDDNFGTDKKRFSDFCDRFRKTYPNRSWSCYFRLGDLTPENVELMSSSGCTGVFVGIETGSERYAKRLSKGVRPADISVAIKRAAEKMHINASFIWGFPDETLNDLRDSLSLIDRLLDNQNVFVNLYQLAPMAGTDVLAAVRNSLAFNSDYISGVIANPTQPLSLEEIALIQSSPDIFSSFYYPSTDLFLKKHDAVMTFMGSNGPTEDSYEMA